MAGFWSTLAVIVTCILAVDATRITHKHVRNDQTTHADIAKRATGKTQFGYFRPGDPLSECNCISPLMRVLYVVLTYGFSQHLPTFLHKR